MSEVSKKVAFLKGMAEGMGLEKEEDAKSKLIARMLEAMEEMADAMDAMEAPALPCSTTTATATLGLSYGA